MRKEGVLIMSEMQLKPHPLECCISEHPKIQTNYTLKYVVRFKDFLILFFLFLISINLVSAVECGSIPTDGCVVTVNTTFNSGTYNLPNGISIGNNNIILNCNGAKLYGNNTGSSVGGGGRGWL